MGILRIATAVALIVSTGLVHGRWTNRWAPTPALAALAARFDSVPMTVGEWTAVPAPLDERKRELAGAEAFLGRVYTNAGRGLSVSVLLLGGLPGDIAAHTPEVCYPGAGYQWSAERGFDHRPRAGGRRAGFRTALATRGGPDPSALRIFWAWRAQEGWVAPEAARWKFASEPTLCKLYVIRETGGAAVDADLDPCNDFLGVFLPELDRAVFPPADERAARERLRSGGHAALPDAGRPRTPQG